MSKQAWKEAWRNQRQFNVWLGRWTPDLVLMAHEAWIQRQSAAFPYAPLKWRLASFKADRRNKERVVA